MKVSIERGSLQWTSLVPLYARYLEHKKENSIYKDEISYEMINKMEYDFTEINSFFDPSSQLTIIVRNLNFEKTINEFIKTHPNATIVNLGSGFDTLFYRIDNKLIKWYDIDLPEVLDLKKHLIPSNPRYFFIKKSVLDFSWFKDFRNNDDGTLMIAGSLFKYLDESEIKNLFKEIRLNLPGAELVFDCGNKILLQIWQHSNIQLNLDPSELKFALEGPEVLDEWNLKISILDHYSFFSRIKRESFWPEEVHKRMDDIDKYGLYKIYHIRFNH